MGSSGSDVLQGLEIAVRRIYFADLLPPRVITSAEMKTDQGELRYSDFTGFLVHQKPCRSGLRVLIFLLLPGG
jgi:hypothetical protein